MFRLIYLILFSLFATFSHAGADLVHNFKNPSFSGIGYSAHVLSTEQLSFNRQKDIDDELQAEADRIA